MSGAASSGSARSLNWMAQFFGACSPMTMWRAVLIPIATANEIAKRS
jgi:hypothetical protein